jgi:hypothetical protein
MDKAGFWVLSTRRISSVFYTHKWPDTARLAGKPPSNIQALETLSDPSISMGHDVEKIFAKLNTSPHKKHKEKLKIS